jgi:hypothetical protein
MSGALGSLVVEVAANVARFQSDMGRIAYIAQQNANTVQRAFDVVGNSLKALGVGLSLGVAIDTVKTKIEQAIKSAADLEDLAQRTGGTIEGLSKLTNVAQVSGTGTDVLAAGLQRLAKTMVDAQQGSEQAAAAFTTLGISTKDLASQRPEDVFTRVATELAKYEDNAAKTALAQELLGRSGANLLPVFNDLVNVGSLAAVTTAEQSAAAKDYELNLLRLQVTVDAVFRTIALQIVPVMGSFVKALVSSANSTDGLRASVDKLAANGSLRQWAEATAMGVARFIDVLSVVPDIFVIVGKTIGAAAAQFAGLGKVLAGVLQMLSGDIAKGVQTAQEGLKQITAVGNLWWQDMQQIWNRPLFSERFKQQLAADAQAMAQSMAQVPSKKPSLPSLPPAVKPPPTTVTADNGALKAQIDAQLKVLDRQIQQEQQLYQIRQQTLQRLYGDDLLSIKDYFAARQASTEQYRQQTLALYDQEVADLQQAMARMADVRAKAELAGRIQEIDQRKLRVTNEVERQTVLDRLDQARATQAYADEVERLNIRLLELQGNLQEAAARQRALDNRSLRQRLTIEQDLPALDALSRIEELQGAQIVQAYADEVERLNIRLLELQGNLQEAAARQNALQNRGLRQRLTIEQDLPALDALQQIENLQTAQAALDQFAATAALVDERLRTAEGRIALDQQTGATTELESLQRLGQARQAAAAQLAEIARQMDAVAQASGNPIMLANVEAFKLRIDELAVSADTLQATFRGIFVGGFSGFLTDLMQGTKSLKEAFLDFARSVEQAITRIVVQNLAQQLFGAGGPLGGLSSFFSSLFGFTPAASGAGVITGGSGLIVPGISGMRADGGPVSANQSYLVGERGPEIFKPSLPGTIVSNEQVKTSALGSPPWRLSPAALGLLLAPLSVLSPASAATAPVAQRAVSAASAVAMSSAAPFAVALPPRLSLPAAAPFVQAVAARLQVPLPAPTAAALPPTLAAPLPPTLANALAHRLAAVAAPAEMVARTEQRELEFLDSSAGGFAQPVMSDKDFASPANTPLAAVGIFNLAASRLEIPAEPATGALGIAMAPALVAGALPQAISSAIPAPFARSLSAALELNIAGSLREGGQAYRNQAYVVGEAGPEIFVPSTAGTVLANRLDGAATPSIVINNSFAPGTDLRTIDQAATQIGLRVQRALRRST